MGYQTRRGNTIKDQPLAGALQISFWIPCNKQLFLPPSVKPRPLELLRYKSMGKFDSVSPTSAPLTVIYLRFAQPESQLVAFTVGINWKTASQLSSNKTMNSETANSFLICLFMFLP
jgi:hypothetical protein